MLLTIITFIVILGLLVLAHELGHFITAKRAGVRVEEFGFGLPPRLFGLYRDPKTKKWKMAGIKTKTAPTTIYSLNWILLGGFVKIKGEQGENAGEEDSFAHKSIGKRICIVSAGVIMNIILTIILFSFGYLIGMPRQIDETIDNRFAKIRNEQIVITNVLKGFPADLAKIQQGDRIVEIDGKLFITIDEIQKYVNSKGNTPLNIRMRRDGKIYDLSLATKPLPKSENLGMGVELAKVGIVSYPWYIAGIQGVLTTLGFANEIVSAFFNLLKDLIISQRVTIELSGPVGIAVMTGEVTRLGFIYILQFTALLSLNLAIINFIPFPALDGGRALFLIIEKIRGKAVNAKMESIIHSIGLYFLLLLILAVTIKDVSRFSNGFRLFLDSLREIL